MELYAAYRNDRLDAEIAEQIAAELDREFAVGRHVVAKTGGA
jgi:hypothetical protein